jgi:Phage integrase family
MSCAARRPSSCSENGRTPDQPSQPGASGCSSPLRTRFTPQRSASWPTKAATCAGRSSCTCCRSSATIRCDRVVLAALREANRVRQLRDLSVIDEGISTHTLRRTYTAIMLAHGNPPKSVQEEAGHADERTTLRIYAQAINTDFKPTKRILTVLCAYTNEPCHDYPYCRQDLDGHLGRRAMSATITFQAGLVERGYAVLPGSHTSTSTIARPRHGSLSDA